jgi:FAD/FMN-containing dehydrogenase
MSGRRLALVSFLAVALAVEPPMLRAAEPAVVNDVTQLNPIRVERVAKPRNGEEVRELVKSHAGPISIGGGRYSMGGQIASDGALFLDMRGMDHVLAFSPRDKTITVETGISWRKIQEAVDPQGLSVKIMQSYANFTVGGSLSVNVHGRYVGQGPLIGSVKSIKIVLADGSLVAASPTENSDLFYGAIGGYGGLGAIVEATLDLADDVRVERDIRSLPVAQYKKFFFENVRNSPGAVFHNGDLYPPAYDRVMAITWSETDRPATIAEHLQPVRPPDWWDHLTLFEVSELPFGKELRAKVIDPVRLRGHPVVWRNYEASYDVGQLEPSSRAHATYVLQEYFVPVERFDDFVPELRRIFQSHHVNVLNVSIRHARKDPGAVLAWAREECFAFVVYYKQGVDEAARREVGAWTRELIDAALAVGGTYYLPYQIHATAEQFRRAYPRADEFFALKRRYDPDYRFRNRLWDCYYHPASAVAASSTSEERTGEKLRGLEHYARAEDQTLLTLPEWYIVYSADEYARFVESGRPPSGFPFFRSIAQFWGLYGAVLRETWAASPFNWGYHAMIGVIGASYTAEYAVKGLYEGTVGRITELVSTNTDEDTFLRDVAHDYAAFVHHTPWYAFGFADRFAGLWRLPAVDGFATLRKWERRFAGSAELAFKAVWGWAMGKASDAAYDPEADRILAWVRPPSRDALQLDGVMVLDSPDARSELVALPRYEPFTKAVSELSRRRVEFVEIAGNREIVMTVIAPRNWNLSADAAREVREWTILTDPTRKRVALSVGVERLHQVVPSLEAGGAAIDHLYDY